MYLEDSVDVIRDNDPERVMDTLPAYVFYRKTVAEFQDRMRSEEHTSELQSRGHLVCRLLLSPLTMSTLFPYTTLFRSAVLAGWTLLERAVLNNYRVRWA